MTRDKATVTIFCNIYQDPSTEQMPSVEVSYRRAHRAVDIVDGVDWE